MLATVHQILGIPSDDVVPYADGDLAAISRELLDVYDVRHIVIEKRLISTVDADRARAVATSLIERGATIAEDDSTITFARIPSTNLPTPAVWLDSGWSYLERLPVLDSSGRSLRWRWMSDAARVGVISDADHDVRLRMVLRAFGGARHLRFSADSALIAEVAVSARDEVYDTPPHLTAGVHFIDIRSVEDPTVAGRDPRQLSVALLRLEWH